MSSLFIVLNMDEWPITSAGISGAALGAVIGGLVVGRIQPTNVVFVSSTVALTVFTLSLVVMNLGAWVLNNYDGGDDL